MSGHELTETDKNAHDSVSEYGDKNSQRRSNLHQEEEILYLECLKIDTDCMQHLQTGRMAIVQYTPGFVADILLLRGGVRL